MADYRINPKTGQVVDIETLPKSGASIPNTGGSSLLPSGLSTVGGMLGEAAGPGGALAGTVIGSAADKLIDPLSKLMKIGPGPMSSEGVGGAMADAATNVGEGIVGDVVKNTVLNKGIGWLGSGLKAAGAAATKFGNAPETLMGAGKRLIGGGMTDAALHMLGVPTGAAEAISAGTALAAPGIARATGPAMTTAGDALPSSALSGLRAVASKFGANPPEEPFTPATPADSVAATVRGARDNMTAGASRSQASQQAGWPLGQSSEVPYQGKPGAARYRDVSVPKDAVPDSLAALRSLNVSPTRMNELLATLGGKGR